MKPLVGILQIFVGGLEMSQGITKTTQPISKGSTDERWKYFKVTR